MALDRLWGGEQCPGGGIIRATVGSVGKGTEFMLVVSKQERLVQKNMYVLAGNVNASMQTLVVAGAGAQEAMPAQASRLQIWFLSQE